MIESAFSDLRQRLFSILLRSGKAGADELYGVFISINTSLIY